MVIIRNRAALQQHVVAFFGGSVRRRITCASESWRPNGRLRGLFLSHFHFLSLSVFQVGGEELIIWIIYNSKDLFCFTE